MLLVNPQIPFVKLKEVIDICLENGYLTMPEEGLDFTLFYTDIGDIIQVLFKAYGYLNNIPKIKHYSQWHTILIRSSLINPLSDFLVDKNLHYHLEPIRGFNNNVMHLTTPLSFNTNAPGASRFTTLILTW